MKIKHIEYYLHNYIILNGILSIKKLETILKTYQIHIPQKKLKQIIKKEGYKIYQNQYYTKLTNKKLIQLLLTEKEKTKYHILTEQELLNYTYLINNMMLEIKTNLKISKEKAYNLLNKIFLYNNIENITKNQKHQIKLRKILNKYQENIRFWSTNGKTKKEYHQEILTKTMLLKSKPEKTTILNCLNQLEPNAYKKINTHYSNNTLTKKELSKIIYNRIKQNIKNYKITYLKNLKECQNENIKYFNYLDDIYLGTVYIYKDKQIPKIIIPEEIEKLLNEIDLKKAKKEEQTKTLITEYLKANGILTKETIKQLLTRHNINISTKEINTIIKEIQGTTISNYYSLISNITEQEIKNILSTKKYNIPIKTININETDQENNLIEDLENYLTTLTHINIEQTENIIDTVIMLIKNNYYSEQLIIEILKTNNIQLNKKETKTILNIIKSYKNDINIWSYNGYTENEYLKIYSTKNMYCHCGSGKKYEKCCGK